MAQQLAEDGAENCRAHGCQCCVLPLRSLTGVLLQGRTTEVEPWYSTDYSQEPVPNEWLSSWLKAVPNPAIHLPQPNPFISSAFGLIDVRMLRMTSCSVSSLIYSCLTC